MNGIEHLLNQVHHEKKLSGSWLVCPICQKTFYRMPCFMKSRNTITCSNPCRHKQHSILMSENPPKSMLGKKHKPETIAKYIERGKDPVWIAQTHTEERNRRLSEKLTGEKHFNWKGGPKVPRDIKNAMRKGHLYFSWRRQVFGRDKYTCQGCNIRSGNGKTVHLQAHHILSFSEFPESRYDVNNGITLCVECHRKETYRTS